jgi:hypothetical protein
MTKFVMKGTKFGVRSTRPSHLIATFAVVALAALLAPVAASAENKKVDGVRADVNRGTLEVKGSAGAPADRRGDRVGERSVRVVDADRIIAGPHLNVYCREVAAGEREIGQPVVAHVDLQLIRVAGLQARDLLHRLGRRNRSHRRDRIAHSPERRQRRVHDAEQHKLRRRRGGSRHVHPGRGRRKHPWRSAGHRASGRKLHRSGAVAVSFRHRRPADRHLGIVGQLFDGLIE